MRAAAGAGRRTSCRTRTEYSGFSFVLHCVRGRTRFPGRGDSVRHLIIIFVALVALTASPARAEWRRAVSTHFIVYSEAQPGELHAATERLERFDGLLRRLSPVPPRENPVRLTVYMPRTIDGVQSLLGWHGAAGYYRGDVEGPFMVSPRTGANRSFDADTILFHEYTHHFMLQNFSTAYPAWFVEGYAELLSTTSFERDGAITVGAFAGHRARELALPPTPLRTLMFQTHNRMPQIERLAYYANAWFLTHYLVLADARRGQLGRYIAAIGQGRAPEQAVEQAFGSLDALQRDFLQYRRAGRIPTIQIRFREAPPVGPIAVEALTPGEENLLWRQARYRQGVRPNDVAGFVRDVRARAAETPNDPGALQLLADAEMLAKDYDAATRAVDALIALRPEAPRALLRKGLIELARLEDAHSEDAARWVAARDWLRRANRAEPDDPLILVEYYRSFERQGQRPPSNALAGLARAYELAPQDLGLRARYADALIQGRRYREAAAVLAPVAYSAHANRGSEAAARLIEAIRALPDGADFRRPAEAAAPAPNPAAS